MPCCGETSRLSSIVVQRDHRAHKTLFHHGVRNWAFPSTIVRKSNLENKRTRHQRTEKLLDWCRPTWDWNPVSTSKCFRGPTTLCHKPNSFFKGTAIFCVITQRVSVIFTDVSGPIFYHETSTRNYHYMLRNNSEDYSPSPPYFEVEAWNHTDFIQLNESVWHA